MSAKQIEPEEHTKQQSDDYTVDAFHRGRFFLVQPKRGHRAGMDAMMLAGCVPGNFSGKLVDLGAGAGGAGLAVAARCENAYVTLVEREAEMVGFANRTLAHPANACITSRTNLINADVSLTGKAREVAGLESNSFDFAIMNPPFNDNSDRASPDTLRRTAHVMDDGLLESWLRTAAAIVRPRGGVAIIARPTSLNEILTAMNGRFGSMKIVPILPRPSDPAIRIIIRATKGSRAALALMPPLVIHNAQGDAFSAHADAINNGRSSVFGD